MRKIFVFVLIAVTLLCEACSAADVPDHTSTTTETHPSLYVWRFENAVPGIMPDAYYEQSLSTEDWLDHNELQDSVSRISIDYPLATDEQVQTYAWDLYDVCMSFDLFDESLVPGMVTFFPDGVLKISFYPYDGLAYDGPLAQMLVSVEDGHIIYFVDYS